MQYGTHFGEDGEPVTITLVQKELSKTDTIVIDKSKNIILDLDGKTLTTSSEGYVIKNYGTLKIVDSSDDKTGKITSTTNNTIYNGSDDNAEENLGESKEIKFNEVKKFNEKDENYFEYKDGKIVNHYNGSSDNSTATGYLELDLTNDEGKYTLVVDASLVSKAGNGYVSITNNPDNSNNVSNKNYGNLISVSSSKDSAQGVIDIAGGQKYYLNFMYKKGSSSSINYDGIFNINSITLNKKQEGKLTLESGTIQIERDGTSDKYYSAIDNGGIVNIEGGKITSKNKYNTGITTLEGGTSNINKGEIELSSSNSGIAIRTAEKGGLTKVTGGEICGYYGVKTEECLANAIVKGGNFDNNNHYQIYNDGKYSLITLEGANLTSEKYNCIYVREEFSDIIINKSKITNNGSAGIDIYGSDSNVYINESTITTKDKAINIEKKANCEITGSTINITGDNEIINCEKGDIHLTITNSTLSNEQSSEKEGINIRGGILNIKGETSIKSTGASIYSAENIETTVNIESGTLESTKSQAISMNNSTGNINIGMKDENVKDNSPSLKSAKSKWTILSNRMKLNIYDGQFIGGKYQIIGTTINELEKGYDLVSDTYQYNGEDGFELVKLGNPEEEAKIMTNDAEEGTTCSTLKQAVEKADNTQNSNNQITIKVLKDIYQARQIQIKKGQNIKIDLNGHKFFAMTDEALYNEGTLEIVDSTKKDSEIESESDEDYNLIGSTGATIIHNVAEKNSDETGSKGKLILGKGIKVNYTTSGVNKEYKYVIKNEGELKTEGTTITVSGEYVHVIDNTGIIDLNRGKITTTGANTYAIYSDSTNINETERSKINGVNISETGSSSYGVYNNNNGIIEINEGTTIESKGPAIDNYSTGQIIINNATITCSGLAHTIYNEAKGIIDINGGKIESQTTSNTYCCIRNNNGGTINIKSGEIIGINTVIYNYNSKEAGTINIEGGTITSKKGNAMQNEKSNEAVINIKGNAIITAANYGVYNHAGILKLGEKGDDTVSTVNPSINGTKYGVYNNGTFYFYDGAITGPIKNSIYGGIADNEDGYQVIRNENEDKKTETATLQQVNIAELRKETDTEEGNTQKFTTVESLQNKLETLDGNEKYIIKVLSNFSIKSKEKLEIPQKLNITMDLNGFSITTAASPVIKNKGNLTIIDSSKELKGNILSELDGQKDSAKIVVYNDENAKLDIESGNITSKGAYGYGLYNSRTGTVSIKGGNIEVSGSNAHGIHNEGILNLSRNTITVNNSNSYAIYNDTNSDNTVKIEASTIESTDGNGIYNANSGTIEIGELENSEGLDEQTNATIISTAKYAIDNHNSGKIVINGANISATSGVCIYNYTNGRIDLKEGKISDTSSLTGSYCIYNYSGGTVNMTGGDVTSSGAAGIYNHNYNEEGTINIEGGTITSSSSYAINNYKSNKSGKVNITGGTLKSNKTYGIYNYSGTLTIGKKIEDTETVSSDAPSENSPTIEGKTYGVYNMGEFYFYDGAISGSEGQSINSNITEIEKGYQVEKSVKDNIETAILKKINIMQINGTNYQTIDDVQKAINAFNGTEELVIEILSDMYMCKSETLTIPQNTTVKLNLNSHTLETSSDVAIDNEGKLTITDDSKEKKGKICGIAKTIINNKNELIMDEGELNAINCVSDRDKSYFINIINNTNKVTWNNGKLIIDIGNGYGIYNSEKGSLDWKDGNVFLNALDDNIYQYAIYVKGNGNIDVKNVDYKIVGYTGNNTYSYQYFIYSKHDYDEKVKVNIDNLVVDDESRLQGMRYGIYGDKLDLTISGGHFKHLNCDDIQLNDSEIHIKGGIFEDEITIPKGTTATISGDSTSIDDISNSGNLNIENGKIKHIACSSNDSNTTMNNGSILNSAGNALEISSGTFTLKGGTIESTKGNGVYINGNGAKFIIGENDSNLTTELPKVIGSEYGIYTKSGQFEFYDGTISGKTKAIYGVVDKTPESYKVKIEENETKATLGVISETENIVSVGNMYFNNMESAVEQANRVSGTIVVHKELTLDKQLTIDSNATVTLSLNGHNLTAEINGPLFTNEGEFTIIDKLPEDDSSSTTTVEAKIENKEGYAISNRGTLIIGTEDNKVNDTTPSIKGKPKAIQNTGKVFWYDGKIDGNTTDQEKEATSEISALKEKIKAGAENIAQELQQVLKIAGVQNPIIKVDKEFPIWTNESVKATIYVPSRIVLDIVNNNENAEVQSINAKKVWKMPEEEAENYRVTIQLMKNENGEIVPALDKQENEITVTIIGNGTQTFYNVPIYEGENKIEYVLKEIKVEKRTSKDSDDWKELPLNEFSVTYDNE